MARAQWQQCVQEQEQGSEGVVPGAVLSGEPADGRAIARCLRNNLSTTPACFLCQDFISFGSGEPPAGEYRSFVLYHNNSPRWAELLKLPIPVDKFRGAHIRFEFRHCSSKCLVGRRGGAGWGVRGLSCHAGARSCRKRATRQKPPRATGEGEGFLRGRQAHVCPKNPQPVWKQRQEEEQHLWTSTAFSFVKTDLSLQT